MARDTYKVPELIYAPAKRGGSQSLILIGGTYGTGKTRSALEVATGLAEGGGIGFCDTEHGRALYYADKFKFDHLDLKEPFRPEAFEAAATISQQRGHKVWICDNFSWEHIGPGGLLNWHQQELDRMAGDDYAKRERMTYTAWIRPKAAHTSMLQRFWQLNAHIILCVQAKKGIELVKDSETGKTKPVDIGWQPVCGDDIPYAMTTALMLEPHRSPGIPRIIKSQEDIDPLIPLDRPLDQETGRAIAAWCRGEKPEPRKTQVQVRAQGQPQPGPKPEGKTSRAESPKNIAVMEGLIARFKGTKTRKDHLDIVDDKDSRLRLDWFRENRPVLYEKINDAIAASWERTEAKRPDGAVEDSGEPPPDDEPPPGGPPDDGWPGPQIDAQGKLIPEDAT